MQQNRVLVLRPRFALGSVLACFFLTTLAIISWNFNIPILRTLVPGFPGMVPTTAMVVSTLGLTLLLALPPTNLPSLSPSRLSMALIFSVLLMSLSAATAIGHLFGIPTPLNLNFIFWEVPFQDGVTSGGNMSIQSSLATLFVATAIFLHLVLTKIEDRIPAEATKRLILLIQVLPILTLGLCCLTAIGYVQNMPRYVSTTKYLGLSLPTLIGLTLLGVSALQLRRDAGYIAMLIGDGSAGLFLRRFVLFSVFGPLAITLIIAWGESQSLYPDSFSLGLFVIFTIGALVAISLVTARAIQETEDQRIGYERAKGRVALQETEENLRETKDRLQFALDASGMGTWELDLTGTGRIHWSKTTEALFGLAPGTFSSRVEDADALVHPDDRDRLAAAQAAAIAEHRDLDADFRCIKPDGLSRWLRVKGRATYDSRGNAIKISGTILDITREKFHQKTIEDALQAAQSANDLKSNFLASMSHEIRTPLGAILGFTELLRDPAISQTDRDEYLKIITRNGETLSQLINDILDLSKVEAGHMNIEVIRFPLRTIVEEVATLLRGKADAKGLEISIQYSNDLPEFVMSDPVRLKQILFNLVGNAIKFTPKGTVHISIHADGKRLVFDVKDTGIGIRVDQRKHLFQPFIQADGSITRRFGGTGLGLSLSRNLAELMGGGVELFESTIGSGSTFRAWIENRDTAKASDALATAEKNTASTSAPVDTKNVSLSGIKILVVDDSLDNQNLIEHILKKRGAVLQFADDGQQATEKTKKSNFDLILMDLQMPVMDGLAATEVVRRQGFKGPIIALTAHAMKDTHADCLRVGCSGFLSKPIDSQNLVKTIHELLYEQPVSFTESPAN